MSLQAITYVGCTVSIVCLLMCFISFSIFRLVVILTSFYQTSVSVKPFTWYEIFMQTWWKSLLKFCRILLKLSFFIPLVIWIIFLFWNCNKNNFDKWEKELNVCKKLFWNVHFNWCFSKTSASWFESPLSKNLLITLSWCINCFNWLCL